MGFGVGIALLASGTALGGGAAVLYYHLVEMATERLTKENRKLRDEVYETHLQWQCDRAYRKGLKDGRDATDAEKFAATWEGRRAQFKKEKEAK